MTAPWGLIFRIFAFACFVIGVILIVAKSDLAELEQLLLIGGLAFWVFATIVDHPHRTV